MNGSQFKPAATGMQSINIWAAVFELVTWWAKEGRAVNRAHRVLHVRGQNSVREPEPFAAVILCTSNPAKVDERNAQ